MSLEILPKSCNANNGQKFAKIKLWAIKRRFYTIKKNSNWKRKKFEVWFFREQIDPLMSISIGWYIQNNNSLRVHIKYYVNER